MNFHGAELPVLLVQCANQHKRITRDIDSVCSECGGASVNAYSPLPNQESYLKGYWTGYHEGETERIWLASANSELRTEVLALSQQIHGLQKELDSK